MDIAITGASGLIGTALSGHLAARGHRIVPMVRHSPSGDQIHWDPDNGQLDPADLAGLDAVVHLAGEPIFARRWNPDHKRRLLDSRVNGTSLIARALSSLENPPPVLLSGSAVGFYGECGDRVVDEGAPKGRGFLADLVAAWEAELAPAVDAGVRVCALRTGIVLSTAGGALAKQLPLFKLGLGGPLGPGDQYMPWISMTDQLGAITHLLDSDVAGPVNLTGPAPATNHEFTKALGTALKRPTVLRIPRFAPKLALGAEMAEELLFTSTRATPQVLADSGYSFAHSTVAQALAAELTGGSR